MTFGCANVRLTWLLRMDTFINGGNVQIHLCTVIYRPPFSKHHHVSLTVFPNEFNEYLKYVITSHHKVITDGDFNIQVEDSSDKETKKICDSLDNMNLRNHVWFWPCVRLLGMIMIVGTYES